MQQLTLGQIDMVSGGMTENQCIGAFTIGGGLLGFGIGAIVGSGPGAVAGAGLGLGFGGGTGLVVCHYLT